MLKLFTPEAVFNAATLLFPSLKELKKEFCAISDAAVKTGAVVNALDTVCPVSRTLLNISCCVVVIELTDDAVATAAFRSGFSW